MKYVDITEVQANFEHYIERAERGEEIAITRDGLPLVKLVACKPLPRIGALKGQFTFDDDASNAMDKEIEKLFNGDDDLPSKCGSQSAPTSPRIGFAAGVAKGSLDYEAFQAADADVAALFYGSESAEPPLTGFAPDICGPEFDDAAWDALDDEIRKEVKGGELFPEDDPTAPSAHRKPGGGDKVG